MVNILPITYGRYLLSVLVIQQRHQTHLRKAQTKCIQGSPRSHSTLDTATLYLSSKGAYNVKPTAAHPPPPTHTLVRNRLHNPSCCTLPHAARVKLHPPPSTHNHLTPARVRHTNTQIIHSHKRLQRTSPQITSCPALSAEHKILHPVPQPSHCCVTTAPEDSDCSESTPQAHNTLRSPSPYLCGQGNNSAVTAVRQPLQLMRSYRSSGWEAPHHPTSHVAAACLLHPQGS